MNEFDKHYRNLGTYDLEVDVSLRLLLDHFHRQSAVPLTITTDHTFLFNIRNNSHTCR